jgi:hypothetical protein
MALIVIWQSPHLPAPKREKRPCGVSTPRQKKGIFGRDRAKNGQRHRRWYFVTAAADASRTDRCYEPSGTPLVVAIPEPEATPAIAAADAADERITSS